MKTLTVKSPAKINLSLRVIRRRRDGYHELVTVFHRLSLADKISFIKDNRNCGIRILSSDKNLPCGPDNLIAKAYGMLRNKVPSLGGVRVQIQKTIPIAAGLGGGSSNAAATLVALNRLFRLGISKCILSQLGAKLGADVAFFVHEWNQAIGSGVGEKLLCCPARKKLWFLLVVTRKGLMTKKVYEALRPAERTASLTKEMATAKILCNLLDRKDFAKASQLLRNDLEPAAFRLRASIKKMLDQLLSLGAGMARMSGSGPTVFAVFTSKKKAEDSARRLKLESPYDRVILCCSA